MCDGPKRISEEKARVRVRVRVRVNVRIMAMHTIADLTGD